MKKKKGKRKEKEVKNKCNWRSINWKQNKGPSPMLFIWGKDCLRMYQWLIKTSLIFEQKLLCHLSHCSDGLIFRVLLLHLLKILKCLLRDYQFSPQVNKILLLLWDLTRIWNVEVGRSAAIPMLLLCLSYSLASGRWDNQGVSYIFSLVFSFSLCYEYTHG